MYQALYRKWRPKTFDDVIGQPHVTETLKRQLTGGRISHAYLFIGTRGTGKTSCAKILAKAVNCADLKDGNPCNVCDFCIGIDNGSILDVEELDAASNSGVDHVRALRDEAIFTPTVAKKRVYIIDEVHGLSIAAFNALLKILEEPPSHILFILATTEAHKVPATIASRCQRFQFKRVAESDICARLRAVSESEGLALQDDGAALLSRLADGSMRDALALLDQCAGGGAIDATLVRQFVGLVGGAEVAKLLGAIGAGDVEAALALVSELYYGGRDMGALLGELSTLLRDILLTRVAPKGSETLLSGNFDRGIIDRFSDMTQETLLLALTQVTETAQTLRECANRKMAVEIAVIRLCDQRAAGSEIRVSHTVTPIETSVDTLSARVAQLEQKLAAGVPVQVVQPAQETPPPNTPKSAPLERPEEGVSPASTAAEIDTPPWMQEASVPTKVESVLQPEVVSVSAPPADEPVPAVERAETGIWQQVLARVKPELDMSVYTLISDNKEVSAALEGDALHIYIENDFFRGVVEKKEVVATLEAAASQVAGSPVRVTCHAGAPTAASPTSKLDALTQKGFGNITIK